MASLDGKLVLVGLLGASVGIVVATVVRGDNATQKGVYTAGAVAGFLAARRVLK